MHTYTLKDRKTGGRLYGKKKDFGGSGRRRRSGGRTGGGGRMGGGAPDSKAGGVALSKPFSIRHVSRTFGDCPGRFLSCF